MTNKSDKPWYERPMRMGALQCNFEGGRKQTLAVADAWHDMGVNVEQLFHPYADSYSALFDKRKHDAILRAYLKKTRSLGTRVIIYMNCHILGPSVADHARNWAQQGADGAFPKLYDTYYATCYNSPWREYFFNVLDSLSAYDIDGIFLDGPVIVADGCHCRFCRERHREWFGGDMNDGPTPYEFNRKTLEMFLQDTYNRFKRMFPDGVVYQNLGVEHARASCLDMRQALKVNDIVGSEGGFMFYGPPAQSWLWRPGFTARLIEALAPRKPRVIFMAADQKSWSWYIHQPGETAACIFSCAANGASIWYGLHGATSLLKTPGCKAAGDAFRFLRRHEAFYDGATSAADVAIFYSYETDTALNLATAASDLYGKGDKKANSGLGDYKIAAKGFADMLIRSHVPFDLLTDLDLERLKRYRCLILPSIACMSDGVAGLLDAYVRDGGHLIATFTTSFADEKGRPRRDFALSGAFGVRSSGRATTYGAFNYMQPRGRHALLRGITIPYLPMAGEALDVRAVAGTKVLLDFLRPLAGRYVPLPPRGTPAATLRRHGKGACLYLAGAFGEHYMRFTAPEYRRLIANAVRGWARPAAELRGDDSPIEMVVRRQPKRLIIHLINGQTVDGRPMVRAVPQSDLRLFVRTTAKSCEARTLVGGDKLSGRASAGGLEFTLPVLNGHETIVVPQCLA